MKLTSENYFSSKANMEYMSVSQFKSFLKCEACALAEAKGKYQRPETTALLVGSYVDACYEGTLDKFLAEHPYLIKSNGALKAEYVQANDIFARTQSDRYFKKLMSGDKQVIMTGVIAGVKVKIKIDSLCKDKIVDLKVVRDFGNVTLDDRGSLPFFEAWRYDLQGAVYQEIVRQNIGKKLPFVLACATKESVTDIEAIQIEQNQLDMNLAMFADMAPSIDAIKKGIIKPNRCDECDYCKATKKLKTPKSSDEFYL